MVVTGKKEEEHDSGQGQHSMGFWRKPPWEGETWTPATIWGRNILKEETVSKTVLSWGWTWPMWETERRPMRLVWSEGEKMACDEEEETGIEKEKWQEGILKFNAFILQRKVQVCCFSQLVKKMSLFSCLLGEIFLVIEGCRSCWTSFLNQPFFSSHSPWTSHWRFPPSRQGWHFHVYWWREM